MDKIMNMAENAYEKYQQHQGGGQQGAPMQTGAFGGQAQSGGQPGGIDWSSLVKMVNNYHGAANNAGGTPSPQHFMQQLSGGGGGGGGGGINLQVIEQLIGHFENSTGSSFNGGGGQMQMLSDMATKYTGHPIPPFVLEKLVAWKTSGSI